MSSETFPSPSEITRANRNDILIRWKDNHESLFPARALRLACPCAACVDETTGAKRIASAAIREDVHPLKISPVGGYAIQIFWSDGHRTGIYSFRQLRTLCPCPLCRKR